MLAIIAANVLKDLTSLREYVSRLFENRRRDVISLNQPRCMSAKRQSLNAGRL